MSNYYLIIVWIFIFAVLSRFVQMERTEVVLGQKAQRMQPLWAVVLVVPLVVWAGYRGYVGDTSAYKKMFSEMPTSISEIAPYIENVTKDKGFYLFSVLIKTIIKNRVELYLIIVAAVQVCFLIKIYRKYSSNYVISFFLFIASTDYISWIFNGIRQFTAATITMYAVELALQKKYVKAVVVVLFASLFHQSALLMIPFLFICQGKAWNKKTLLFITAVIIAVFFVDKFTGILEEALSETQYVNVVSDWKSWEDDGTNILRVIVYSIPTLLSLIGLKYIKIEDNPWIHLCVNMAIVSSGFYVISMFTSGIFIGRLPIYFSLYNYILLPWEIDHMFEEKSARFIYIGMIVGYLVFYYMHIKLVWGLV